MTPDDTKGTLHGPSTGISGVSPEVAVYDERVSSYVISGLLEPLTELMRRDGITKDDFWLPCPTQRSSSAPPARTRDCGSRVSNTVAITRSGGRAE
jgi:hypothetical protein